MKIQSKLWCLTLVLASSISMAQQGVHAEISYSKEVQKLSKKSMISRAFDRIKALEEETLRHHIELTEIAAPPFMEQQRAASFSDRLKQVGVDSIWTDAVGNVIGLIRGSKSAKTVALNAHLDTVFPEGTDVSVRVSNDTLYAPGIGDDTRGLAILITVAEVIGELEIKPKSDVLLIASVGEEGLGDLRGVKELFSERGPKIDSWIAIDGGSIGRVNTKALGSYRYKLTFEGPGGHSWGAFGLANPHHALGSAIHHFVGLANAYTSEGPKTSYNVGVIEGGTSINSVPFSSSMLIDIRSVEPYRLDEMEQLLDQSMQEALEQQNSIRRRGEALTATLEKIGNRPSGALDPGLPLIQRAIAATELFGVAAELTRGSTDSNIPISMGIPAITIGRGGTGGKAHSLDEWWFDEKGYEAVQYALLVLLAEAGI